MCNILLAEELFIMPLTCSWVFSHCGVRRLTTSPRQVLKARYLIKVFSIEFTPKLNGVQKALLSISSWFKANNYTAKDPEGLDWDRRIPLRWGTRILRVAQPEWDSRNTFEFSPEGSFAFIPYPAARWAKLPHNDIIWASPYDVWSSGMAGK